MDSLLTKQECKDADTILNFLCERHFDELDQKQNPREFLAHDKAVAAIAKLILSYLSQDINKIRLVILLTLKVI